jgi:hypothetical protein
MPYLQSINKVIFSLTSGLEHYSFFGAKYVGRHDIVLSLGAMVDLPEVQDISLSVVRPHVILTAIL